MGCGMLSFRMSAVLALSLVTGAVHAVEPVADFGNNPGNLKMYQHVPPSVTGSMPVVLLLHGCGQLAESYAVSTGWVDLANQWGFALVLAEQQALNNAGLCFNWFQPQDTTRGQGEAESMHQMLVHFSSAHAVDAARVFVVGVSSGGAMANVMLANHPDLFSAGAVFAGCPVGCASSVTEAVTCMTTGRTRTAVQWGDSVRSAGSFTGPRPRVSIWHGTLDTTVSSANAAAEVLQWTDVLGIPSTPSSTSTSGLDTLTLYSDVALGVRVEEHVVTGMGHGTPVDPGTGAEQCGTAGAYLLDVNICSARAAARFFGLDVVAPEEDAGPPPSDAGAGETDAAVALQDAGAGSDAGKRDDGSYIPALTCQCARGMEHTPALGLCLLLAGVRRRR
jgi:poly(hydroxyalkanoate) depolymerase family esterase